MKRFAWMTALLAVPIVALAACDSSSTEPDEDVVTVTLTHDGFDFSAEQSDTLVYANNDGEVITWQPGASSSESAPNSVWWRNDRTTGDGSNATVDLGSVELASVTDVPTTFETAPGISPLVVGHVYVARCHDGYVKFKVRATSFDAWTATVDYVYTTGTTF